MNKISVSKTNKNIIIRVAALLVLALLVLAVPFAAKVSAAPGHSDQAAPAGAEGVQGGAFEVTEYDLNKRKHPGSAAECGIRDTERQFPYK